MAIPVGTPAPEFTLPDQNGEKRSLSQYKGKVVVLAWFPLAFTSGWANQVSSFHRAVKRFEEKGAQVLSASADSQYSQRAFGVGLGMVTHPILADWHPKGEVAKAYGVWNDRGGNPIRSVFIIDKSGVVRFSREYTGGLPNVDEVLAEVDKLK